MEPVQKLDEYMLDDLLIEVIDAGEDLGEIAPFHELEHEVEEPVSRPALVEQLNDVRAAKLRDERNLTRETRSRVGCVRPAVDLENLERHRGTVVQTRRAVHAAEATSSKRCVDKIALEHFADLRKLHSGMVMRRPSCSLARCDGPRLVSAEHRHEDRDSEKAAPQEGENH